MSDDYDPLEPDEQDALAATARALANMVPMVGGVIGELFTQGIPKQRMDRFGDYVRELQARVSDLEANWSEMLSDPDRVDLIEEGAYQAVRATSNRRIEQIARLVADGITSDDAKVIRRNRLARLLAQVDDDELLLLNTYGQAYGGNAQVWNDLERPDPAHRNSTVSEIDNARLFDAGRARLLQLGLLEKRYRKAMRGKEIKFDPRKGDYDHTVEISYLGRMLLRSIGQPSPIDDRPQNTAH